MQFNFSKWQGAGNDFVIVNTLKEQITAYSQTALQICDRHFGIGADGLVLIAPSDKADFKMIIFNSDGSEADMCGNATRCVARYVYEYGLTDKTKITLETKAGLIKPELVFIDGILSTVRVDMGEPRLQRNKIPMAGNAKEQAINVPLEIAGETYFITGVSVGNPHCVIFVDDITTVNLAKIGPLLETSSLFPCKTNVEFVQILNRQHLRMRVWERGAGITLACGTGSCATLVAAVLNGKADRKATIDLDGGSLFIEWESDQHVYMSGPASEVFQGVWC
jgi:diaminopimelate epimerase